MDKYGTGNDPACYPGTNTLINLLEIQNQTILEEAERDLTTLVVDDIPVLAPPFNLTDLCEVHRILFEDIYAWAGQLRTIDISKGDSHFCNVRFLSNEASKIFLKLAKHNNLEGIPRNQLVIQTADYYGEINAIHPFREGNGRAQRVLFESIVAHAGYEISWDSIEREEWIHANIQSFNCNPKPLEAIFERCIGNLIRE